MRQRDIVLVPFPFSDQSGTRARPALVLSNDEFNKSDDLIICAITSNLKPARYGIFIDQRNLESGFLPDKSAIKVESMLKIKKSLVIKSIGKLDRTTFAKAHNVLLKLFEP